MKKLLIPLIALFALTLTAGAQDKMGKRGHHQKHKKGVLAKQLNFTEDQKKQAKTINEESRKKMQELNKNEHITVKEMRTRKAAILKERKTKMDGLLTAEQKTKMINLKARHKVKKEEHYAKRMDKMKTHLDLTDAQVLKLKEQRSALHAKAAIIKKNELLSPEQKKAQMMALKMEAKEQHHKILTPEQYKKQEELRKNHRNRAPVKK